MHDLAPFKRWKNGSHVPIAALLPVVGCFVGHSCSKVVSGFGAKLGQFLRENSACRSYDAHPVGIRQLIKAHCHPPQAQPPLAGAPEILGSDFLQSLWEQQYVEFDGPLKPADKLPAHFGENFRVFPVLEVVMLSPAPARSAVHPASLPATATIVFAADTAPLALGFALEIEFRGSHGQAPRFIARGNSLLQGVSET
ncbi:MAG TPA: hypothetical protein VKE94_13005 [Gemmataceae bacterium]|nr:hypothetical protein [Gemmataceae bacterium]